MSYAIAYPVTDEEGRAVFAFTPPAEEPFVVCAGEDGPWCPLPRWSVVQSERRVYDGSGRLVELVQTDGAGNVTARLVRT